MHVLIFQRRKIGEGEVGRMRTAGARTSLRIQYSTGSRDTMSSDRELFYPHPSAVRDSLVPSVARYKQLHQQSLDDPDTFWAEQARALYWNRAPSGELLTYNFDRAKGPIAVRFMHDAVTNACFNALDVHVLNGYGDRVAYYW